MKKKIEEYIHPEPRDLRLSPAELRDELTEYIKQFISETDLTDDIVQMIKDDSHSFVVRCLLNFRQK